MERGEGALARQVASDLSRPPRPGLEVPWKTVCWLAVLTAAALLRFHNPGHQWLSHDEVFTALRSAGYPAADLDALTAPSDLLPAGLLRRTLFLRDDLGWGDTLRELMGHPEHPPLYFLLVRLLRQGWSDSTESMRQLSALFSLLALPAMYLLTLELSGRSGLSAVVVALVAVSPLHLLIAQDARPYSLLVLLTALGSWSHLRLQRTGGAFACVRYTLILVAGLYTSLLFLLIPLSHGLHLLLPGHTPAQRRHWTGATAAAVLAFLPWVAVLATRLDRLVSHTAWLRDPPSTLAAPLVRGLHWSSPFVDLGQQTPPWGPILVLPALLALMGTGVVTLARCGRPGGWSLLVLLAGLNVLAVALPDLVLGGRHSLMTRYLLPATLSLQVLIAAGLWSRLRSRRWQAWGVALLVILLVGGAASCGSIQASETWWSRYTLHEPATLKTILQAHPGAVLHVVRSPTSLGEAISLAQKLDPETRLRFVDAYLPAGTAGVLYTNHLGQVLAPAWARGRTAGLQGDEPAQASAIRRVSKPAWGFSQPFQVEPAPVTLIWPAWQFTER